MINWCNAEQDSVLLTVNTIWMLVIKQLLCKNRFQVLIHCWTAVIGPETSTDKNDSPNPSYKLK